MPGQPIADGYRATERNTSHAKEDSSDGEAGANDTKDALSLRAGQPSRGLESPFDGSATAAEQKGYGGKLLLHSSFDVPPKKAGKLLDKKRKYRTMSRAVELDRLDRLVKLASNA